MRYIVQRGGPEERSGRERAAATPRVPYLTVYVDANLNSVEYGREHTKRKRSAQRTTKNLNLGSCK
jgi:hypothetical protein